MRRFGTWLVLALAAVGCGPISDWPSSSTGDDSDNPSLPVTGGDSGTAVTTPPANPGGGSVPGTTSDAGTSAPAGAVMDAGTASGRDASSQGTSGGDAAETDGGLADGGVRDGSVRDASLGDTGLGDASLGDGSVRDASPGDSAVDAGDAACSFSVDAGAERSCSAYGCGTTLSTLGARSADGGVCVTPEVLPLACDGQLSRAAVQCTQQNALGLGMGRPVTMCLRRSPAFGRVQGDCLQCYADEALCTLSRCFAVCIDGSDPACEACRRQTCGAPFARCSGLPAF